MSEQDEFEQVASSLGMDTGKYPMEPMLRNSGQYEHPATAHGWKLWQACVERNYFQYEDIFDEISKVYYHITDGRLSKLNTDSIHIIQAHDDQINALEDKIEQQAAEIEALRVIIKSMVDSEAFDDEYLFELGLLDEDINPTPLLTGEASE